MGAPDLRTSFVRTIAAALGSLTVAAAIARHSVDAAGSCEAVARLALPGVAITLAESVEAGAFKPPAQLNPDLVRTLPAFCRVGATLKPSSDSDITIEVWLPASRWNGKFLAVGNGAFNGSIGYTALMTAVVRGYAASSTDTGHTGGSASLALGHPEKVIDFGWRAVHEMTTTAKRIAGGALNDSDVERLATEVGLS